MTRDHARSGAIVTAVALCGVAAACARPLPPLQATACPQTSEFGNFGCAEIVGRVLDREGRPLAQVSVGPRYLPPGVADAGQYNTYFVDTDTAGRFRFRVTRFGQRRVVPVPDTFSLFVHATMRPPVVGASPPAVDSMLVQAELAPPGRIPTPTVIELRLRYP